MVKKLILFTVFLLQTSILLGQDKDVKKDTIITVDGIKIIGEIKELDILKLVMSTSYSKDDFHIKWDEITTIKSEKHYTFFFNNGSRERGRIASLDNHYIELIDDDNTKVKLLRKKIIGFKLTENLFSDRFKAHTDLSLSHKKALKYFQYNIDIGLNYDTSKFSYLLEFNTNSVYTNNNPDIHRLTFNAGYDRYLKNNFYLTYRLKLFKNSQQNLTLRTTTFSSYGLKFIHKPQVKAQADLGFSINHEKFTYNQDFKTSIEIYSGLKIKLLDFNDNTLEFTSHHYLSTTQDRFRADSQLDYKHDLPHDFYIKASYTYNYDTSLTDSNKKLDYVTTLGLGWKF